MRVHEKTGRPIPWYQDVDGFRIPGIFDKDVFRAALKYEPRPDDLFIVTYPKCGTTWTQNIIAGIFRRGNPLTDVIDFFCATPFLEMSGPEAAIKMKRPGSIKVHLPFHLTPYNPETKYIYVARNPKDCVVSFYYHSQNPAYDFKDGSFDDYFELFINGETDFGDYFDTLLSWYEHRNDKNVLFLKYEDLKKDIEGNIMKIAEFIDIKYKEMIENDPSIMTKLIENTSVKSMREAWKRSFLTVKELSEEELNSLDIPDALKKLLGSPLFREEDKNPNDFIRKGIVGDWRNHLSDEQNARLEAKFRERTKGTEIIDWWQDCM